MNVPGEGRFPWRRLLGSLLGAPLVAMAGFIALLADVVQPRRLHSAIEIIALPVVRLVYLVGGLRSDSAIWLAVLSSNRTQPLRADRLGSRQSRPV